MKIRLKILVVPILILLLVSGCEHASFVGSRIGTRSQFVMKYKIFNMTEEQSLRLESGDTLRAEIVVDSGKLSVKIQKDNDTPIYEDTNKAESENFDIEILESGTYKVTVTGEKAKGSVSFKKVEREKEKQEEVQREADNGELILREAFQEMNGCAVFHSPEQEDYLFYNEEMCSQQESPYSTFKIISALSGLQNGVLSNETSTMGYDGTDYGNSEWNGSNVNSMEKLNGFWLDSSLKISPLEQVKVLEKIFEGQSDYDSSNIEILKNIMLADENDRGKVYGKTGSDGNGKAWFVGFAEMDGEREYFAIYLDDNSQKEQISGMKAKEIALEILKQL